MGRVSSSATLGAPHGIPTGRLGSSMTPVARLPAVACAASGRSHRRNAAVPVLARSALGQRPPVAWNRPRRDRAGLPSARRPDRRAARGAQIPSSACLLGNRACDYRRKGPRAIRAEEREAASATGRPRWPRAARPTGRSRCPTGRAHGRHGLRPRGGRWRHVAIRPGTGDEVRPAPVEHRGMASANQPTRAVRLRRPGLAGWRDGRDPVAPWRCG
jgi:hypothetical protein